MTTNEYEKVAEDSKEYLNSKIEASTSEFRLREYERLNFSQDTGLLVFYDGDTPKVAAKAQVLDQSAGR